MTKIFYDLEFNETVTLKKDYSGYLPAQSGTGHNALDDAKYNLQMAEWMGLL